MYHRCETTVYECYQLVLTWLIVPLNRKQELIIKDGLPVKGQCHTRHWKALSVCYCGITFKVNTTDIWGNIQHSKT